ncbi:hypothetical protein [Aeromicrobium sp. CTD01-1L150]|uniref:hypothetical protein n=1 Tax=Aeromicrobium sp. CTD01-1L150 TaxID=3341830 RepID=UPI0035C09801
MHFRSSWRFDVPRRELWQVFEELVDAPDPFIWWPGLHVVDRDGDEIELEARSVLAYRLRFRLHGLTASAPEQISFLCDGDLRGRAAASLIEHGSDASSALIDWTVTVRRPWMRRTLPLLRPAFIGAHHHMMRRGRLGLRAHLER